MIKPVLRWIASQLERRGYTENELAKHWANIAAGGATVDGGPVSERTALAISTFYTCARVLAEATAASRLIYYERTSAGRERATSDPLFRLLAVQPNPVMTAFQWIETLVLHLVLRGNHYAVLKRDRDGLVEGIYPVHPDRMKVFVTNTGRPGEMAPELVYQYAPRTGTPYFLPQSSVLHVRGLSPDGLVGYSPISVAGATLSRAAEENNYGARFFANDASPNGVLEHPSRLDDEPYERLKRDWTENHGGTSQHSFAILEEGMKWVQVGVSAKDAQIIEARGFSRTDVCGINKVPPPLAGILDRATWSNASELDRQFLTHTLVPLFERIEAQLVVQVVPIYQQATHYPEFLAENLLRGDPVARWKSHETAFRWGIVNRDEIRAKENMNPTGDKAGKTYWMPLNYAPADQLAAGLSETKRAIADGCSCEECETKRLEALGRDRLEAGAEEHKGALTGHGRGTNGGAVETRSVDSRLALADSFAPLLAGALARVVRREAQKITAAARRELEARTAEGFVEWLRTFYSDTEYFENQIRPVLRAFADALGVIAADEIDEEFLMTEPLADELERYLAGFAASHSNMSRAQVEGVVYDNLDDPLGAVETRMSEWVEGIDGGATRAEKIAGFQTNDFHNAFSAATWAAAGWFVLEWVTRGETCVYCNALAGRRVESGGKFIAKGENFRPDGAPSTMTPKRNVRRPPGHAGCDCYLIPRKGA
jgi:HK97 family phage portal protein